VNRLTRSATNILASTLGFAGPVLINLVATPLLLRALGQAAYGLSSLVAVLTGYLAIMDLGLDIPIVKYLAEDYARHDLEAGARLLNTTLKLYLGIGIVGMAGMVLLSDFLVRHVFRIPPELSGQATLVFMFSGLGFLGSLLNAWGRAVANGVQRYEVSGIVSTAGSILGVALGLGVVYIGYGVAGYALTRAVILILTGLIYIAVARRLVAGLRLSFEFDWNVVRRIRSYLGSGIIMRSLSAVSSNMDYTLISIWLGVAALAIYSLPFLLFNNASYLIFTMLNFAFPMSSELSSSGQIEKLRDFYARAVRFVAALATMVFVPLLLLGDAFFTIWVGRSFANQAGTTLHLLLLSGYVSTLAITLGSAVAVGTGHIRDYTLYSLLRSAVIVVLCALLIRPLGIAGAGVAWLAAAGVDVIFQFIVVREYLRMSVWPLMRFAYFKPILLGCAMALLSWFIRPFAYSWPGMFAIVGALEAAYIVAGYRMGIFGETEKRAVLGLWQVTVGRIAGVMGKVPSQP